VADFLSDEWIAELALACDGSRRVDGAIADPSVRFVIEPVVRGVPGRGEVRYRIVFSEGTCAVVADRGVGARAPHDAADVHLETDYVTAAAISRGTANAQEALADGRLRVSGDVARLAEHAAALARVDDLFAVLRETTTYPAPR
jgi:SCP-2 sterol transfer family